MLVKQHDARKHYRTLELPNGIAEIWLELAGTRVELHHKHPTGSGSSNWTRCHVNGCLGEAIRNQPKCIQHVDETNRTHYLKYIADTKNALSLRGTVVTQEVMQAIFASPVMVENKLIVPVSFSGAEICIRLDFNEVTFTRSLDFTGATIREPFSFRNCTFGSHFMAGFAFFNAGPPHFQNTNFASTVDISFAHTERVSFGFTDCVFQQSLTADGLTGALILERCQAQADVRIRGAKTEAIVLRDSSVAGELDVAHTHCMGFHGQYLRAPHTHQIGPLIVEHDCSLSRSQWGARVRIEVKANYLDLSGAQFLEGGHLSMAGPSANLQQLNTGRPLSIAGNAEDKETTGILSIQDADAGLMSFANVDMSRCIFYGAHDLGSIVIEPTVKFAKTPGWPYTGRKCIADEFAWRGRNGGWFSTRWKLPNTFLSTDPKGIANVERDTLILPSLKASQVAAVYRDLRRSFEAKSDEPGAADFYYGEMEMRRYSVEAGIAERIIVWLYWLFSGYGLRASRAFFGLAILITIGAVTLTWYGFQRSASYLEGFLFALKAAIPGIERQANLTATGEFIEISLAVFGPVLFALGVLALRGRIKR